jgi:pSer/pThr/pTyr-binding forkhead associated (FHA) protein
MDARFYNSDDIDIERLALDLVKAYQAQGYNAQNIGDQNQMLVQLKKGGDFEAILGMQAALSLSIQRTAGGVLAMIGKQRWIDKAAVGAIGIVGITFLWPLAVTAGVGAFRQASLANQALNMVDGLVRQQRPGIVGGSIPSNLLPQVHQQWLPLPAPSTPTYAPSQPVSPEPMYVPPSPARVVAALPSPAPVSSPYRCSNCNTPYERGDTFCTGCGRPLTAAKVYCSNCNSELKSGVSFCPRCGTTTFSVVSNAQNAQPAPRPAPTPVQPTITYVPSMPQPPVHTPPAQSVQSTPVYTPPPQPVKPETPVYTPPPAPLKPVQPVYTPPTPKKPEQPPTPQVYYVPSQPTQLDHNAPTIYDTPASPSKPEEPYYVPPATQEPAIKPQPKVTIVPGTPMQEPPPPQKPRPQKQYYIPSNQAQPTANQPAPPDTTSSSQIPATVAAKPVVAQPGTSSASTDTPWGLLIFSDGQEVQLNGESASVGRSDHDLGGLQPEVDLGNMPGADTVSRLHAALEHIGSSYTVTDLNSTNATRINGKRLEPDKPTAINDGDTLQFGKITSTFKTT